MTPGAPIHLHARTGHGTGLDDSAYVGAASAVELVSAIKDGAMLVVMYASTAQALRKRLLAKHITCLAMERIPRISRAVSARRR